MAAGPLHIAAFTGQGTALARKLAAALQDAGWQARVWASSRFAQAAGVQELNGLQPWTKRAFEEAEAILFVSATGIAVRAIAPYVADKFSDPAVVCTDELGRFAVPLLSGHVGGANELARLVAGITGGQAVVSTATDVNGLFAVDEWAARSNLAISSRELAKRVSANLLEGKPVGFCNSLAIAGTPPKGLSLLWSAQDKPELGIYVGWQKDSPFIQTLRLAPRCLAVGVGCRKDTPAEALLQAVAAALDACYAAADAVGCLASIDIKRNEPAIAQLCEESGWPARFFSAEELAAAPGSYTESAFVEQTVGVGNVCERAAMLAAAQLAGPENPNEAELIYEKHAGGGCTVAIACLEANLEFPKD